MHWSMLISLHPNLICHKVTTFVATVGQLMMQKALRDLLVK